MKIIVSFLLFLLIGCSQNPLKGFGQSDIDIISNEANPLSASNLLTDVLFKFKIL